MKKLYKVLPLTFLMMFCLFAFVEIGSAYCVHNNSSVTLVVHGEFCVRCYEGTLHSGDTGCCPGGDAGCRGTTTIYASCNCDIISGCSDCPCPCEVTAHGDVYITGDDYYHLYARVYDDNGNQICEGPVK